MTVLCDQTFDTCNSAKDWGYRHELGNLNKLCAQIQGD
ncbi:Poly(ADP-ribose) glycohydrolase ARH3, partial [Araneus ventricosus]